MNTCDSPIRIGTRGSTLALAQATQVADAITRATSRPAGLVIIRTTGEVVLDRPLHEVGGKGVFVREIEQALLDRRIDLAIHSAKDLPVTQSLVDVSSLVIASTPIRQDPRDVLITREGFDLRSLPVGARVGTSSPRRTALLLDARRDVQIIPLRGNIDTRLRRLAEGAYDAIILAAAGLIRTGWIDPTVEGAGATRPRVLEISVGSDAGFPAGLYAVMLDVDSFTPAAGQGVLALQARQDDASILTAARSIDDPMTHRVLEIERAVVAALDGDCHSPIGALARTEGDQVRLLACLGGAGGTPPVRRFDGAASPGEVDALVTSAVAVLRHDQSTNSQG